MWISRKRLNELESRIRNLETEVFVLRERSIISLYEDVSGRLLPYSYRDVPIKEVIHRILDHLNIKLTFTRSYESISITELHKTKE